MVSDDRSTKALFETITDLTVGEALLFSSDALLTLADDGKPKKLGAGYLKIRTRKRLGEDGGRSVVAGNRDQYEGDAEDRDDAT